VSNQELNNQLAQAIDSAIDRMINDIHDWCVLEIERLAEKDQCQQVDLRRALSAVYRLEVEYKFIQQELKDFAQHLSPNLLSKVETHLQHVPSLLGLKIKRNNPALSGLIEELNRDAASKDLGVTAEANWSLAILRRLRLVTRNTLNTKLSKQSKQA
jgi:hypothetical protein